MNNTLFQWEQNGWLRTMQPHGRTPEGECQHLPERQLILMGSGITDHNGEWTFIVRDALCVPLHAVNWVSLVATPSRFFEGNHLAVFPPLEAEFVTTGWAINNNQLTLYVKSWAPFGEQKPNVHFSYHVAIMHHLGQ